MRLAFLGLGVMGYPMAGHLAKAGHDVTVFERDPAPGGMLRYGIPQYRLPKVEVLEAEYESVTRLGAEIRKQGGRRRQAVRARDFLGQPEANAGGVEGPALAIESGQRRVAIREAIERTGRGNADQRGEPRELLEQRLVAASAPCERRGHLREPALHRGPPGRPRTAKGTSRSPSSMT